MPTDVSFHDDQPEQGRRDKARPPRCAVPHPFIVGMACRRNTDHDGDHVGRKRDTSYYWPRNDDATETSVSYLVQHLFYDGTWRDTTLGCDTPEQARRWLVPSKGGGRRIVKRTVVTEVIEENA